MEGWEYGGRNGGFVEFEIAGDDCMFIAGYGVPAPMCSLVQFVLFLGQLSSNPKTVRRSSSSCFTRLG